MHYIVLDLLLMVKPSYEYLIFFYLTDNIMLFY
jgi:hypothetical protein